MITKIEWKNGLWIAHLNVGGEHEEAVSRRSFLDLLNVANRAIETIRRRQKEKAEQAKQEDLMAKCAMLLGALGILS